MASWEDPRYIRTHRPLHPHQPPPPQSQRHFQPQQPQCTHNPQWKHHAELKHQGLHLQHANHGLVHLKIRHLEARGSDIHRNPTRSRNGKETASVDEAWR